MIDPFNITNYNMTDNELEEVLLFWVCAAGKTAVVAAKGLEKVLTAVIYNNISPFEGIRLNKTLSPYPLSEALKLFGIGCYNGKARTMEELAFSDLNLRTCTTDDLEKIYGIGMKTSRCFIIHSRRDAQCAGLDTHVLKFLRSRGHDVPKSTPGSRKKYKELEQLFLNYANKSDKSVAEFDLDIWRYYSDKTSNSGKKRFEYAEG